MRVYKYVICPAATLEIISELRMPADARPLSVGWQDKIGVVMWASVNGYDNTDPVPFEFEFVPTGGDHTPGLPFVGTVQMPGGIVGHLFCEGAG